MANRPEAPSARPCVDLSTAGGGPRRLFGWWSAVLPRLLQLAAAHLRDQYINAAEYTQQRLYHLGPYLHAVQDLPSNGILQLDALIWKTRGGGRCGLTSCLYIAFKKSLNCLHNSMDMKQLSVSGWKLAPGIIFFGFHAAEMPTHPREFPVEA